MALVPPICVHIHVEGAAPCQLHQRPLLESVCGLISHTGRDNRQTLRCQRRAAQPSSPRPSGSAHARRVIYYGGAGVGAAPRAARAGGSAQQQCVCVAAGAAVAATAVAVSGAADDTRRLWWWPVARLASTSRRARQSRLWCCMTAAGGSVVCVPQFACGSTQRGTRARTLACVFRGVTPSAAAGAAVLLLQATQEV